MALSKNTAKKFTSVALALAILPLLQNCSPLGQVFSKEQASSTTGEATSPSTAAPTNPPILDKMGNTNSQQYHVVNKTYVAQILREIFTSVTFPNSGLEGLLDTWVEFRGPQYGGSCLIYSGYSTRDCNLAISNTDIDHFAEDNSLRQSYRIQACDNILGVDASIDAALEKVSLTRASPINAANLTAIYGLFYRDGPPEELTLSTLLVLDTALQAKSYNLLNRWRGSLTQICESSAWQLF